MALLDFSILDVGHGNCALLIDNDVVAIIDAPAGDALVETLDFHHITVVEAVVISHADADHVGGVMTLLLQPEYNVRQVFVNPDAYKGSASWHDFRVALKKSRTTKATAVRTQLTSGTVLPSMGRLRMEVLSPAPEIALSGPGGKDLRGRPLTSNSVSAVIRVLRKGVPIALLAGDLDSVGLENMLTEQTDVRAPILVYPHHGGRPGSASPFAFAKNLCEAVEPDVVIFSIGRGMHGNPLPEVIAGVRAVRPRAHIACTQLSKQCAAQLPASGLGHLSSRPARGRSQGMCCAGTIVINPQKDGKLLEPKPKLHLRFIRRGAKDALCLRKMGR